MLPNGTRDILGLWIESTEESKFRMRVFNDLKTHGAADNLVAVTDGLTIWPRFWRGVRPPHCIHASYT